MLNDKQFCVVVSSAVALVAFVCLMRFLPDVMAWTGWPMCDKGTCNVQSCLGALSGWFGGIAAFGTIAFVVLQLREQRLQTAFTVGDAQPTMDAIEHLNDSSELVVRIVNWNRRGLIVRSLDVDDTNTIVLTNNLTVDGKVVATDFLQFGIKPFHVRGWEDRGKAPHYAEIRLAAMREIETDLSFAKNWRDIRRITADVQILGDSHKITQLRADTGPILS